MNDDAAPATKAAGDLNGPPPPVSTAVGLGRPGSQPGASRVEYVFTPPAPGSRTGRHFRSENWLGRFMWSLLDLFHKANEWISVRLGTRSRRSGC